MLIAVLVFALVLTSRVTYSLRMLLCRVCGQ